MVLQFTEINLSPGLSGTPVAGAVVFKGDAVSFVLGGRAMANLLAF